MRHSSKLINPRVVGGFSWPARFAKVPTVSSWTTLERRPIVESMDRTRVPRYDRHATQIRARPGESFVLELPVRATGGYRWQVTRVPAVAVLQEERIRPGGPALGATSIQEFVFVATGVGAGVLVIEHRRSWEPSASEQLDLNIIVEP